MEVGIVTKRGAASNAGRSVIFAAAMLCPCAAIRAQVASGQPSFADWQNPPSPIHESEPKASSRQDSEAELQTGTALTRQGFFAEAIPHLLAARGRVSNEYAATFNLALCYLGTNQFQPAIQILTALKRDGYDGADVENVLAQAYVGSGQPQQALASLRKAAAVSPQSEKLYLFIADACREHRDYSLGLKVVSMGLESLPRSARLHYERAIFLTELDEFDRAKPDFEAATNLAEGSEIGYLAAAHKELSEGKISEAIRSAREGVQQGPNSHALLTLLGEALIRSGINPGQAEFVEAQTALEKAVAEQSNDPASQLALGRVYLLGDRLEDAIAHLEKAGELEPDKPAVYANLAKAYRRHGEIERAQDALAQLEQLNQNQAERINSAPGDRKLGYARRGVAEEAGPQP
jgi:predicted Zn-dependent protease